MKVQQTDRVSELREGLRTNDWQEFVKFVRRQVVEQKGRSETVKISPELREAARKELEPGGYWSPEAVADRIMNFALSWAGEDPEKLKIARDAIMQGFAQAEKVLGQLPDVSVKTRQLVEQRFEELLGKSPEAPSETKSA